MFRTLSRYYSYFWHYRRFFILFLLGIIITGILSSLSPYFYKLFIETLPEKNFERLIQILILFFLARFLSSILFTLTFYVGDKMLIASSKDVRMAVFKRVQELDFAYHVKKSSGALISAIKRGDGAYFGIFLELNLQTALKIVEFIVLVWFFTLLDPRLAVLTVVAFILTLLSAYILIPMNVKKRTAFNTAEDDLSGIIVDNMINFETVKYFGREQSEQNRLNESYKPWTKAVWGYANTFRSIDVTVTTISNISMAIIIYVGLLGMVQGQYSIADFVLIIGFITSFFPKLESLVYNLRNVTKQYADIEVYMNILDEEVEIKDPKYPQTLSTVKGNISFKSASFGYDKRHSVFEDLSISINQGESIALVGKSGAGKTTFVKLLLRFYDVDSGEITIDGINVKNFNKSYLRSIIGVVPQEAIMFNNTIAYNIAYGTDHASREQIIKAAKLANLDTFINSLPKKYETQVGERGLKLSGGQKQRLAIARMLLVNNQIIVFDEATSNLDSESERLIQDAFWKVSKDKTTIIIAHRLSTVMKADRIIVFENGKIIEEGDHKTLMKKNSGLYKRLWDLQVKGLLEE